MVLELDVTLLQLMGELSVEALMEGLIRHLLRREVGVVSLLLLLL